MLASTFILCYLDQVEKKLIVYFLYLAQMGKNLPAVQETWVWFLGLADLLEKRMATHSSILAWRIPWTEEPDGLQSMGHKELDTTEQLTLSLLMNPKKHFLAGYLLG